VIASLVNLTDYPLDQPDSGQYRSLVDSLGRQLAETGLINIPNFLTLNAIEKFNNEINERMPQAFYSEHGPSSYFDAYPGELPYDILNSTSYCMGRDKLLNTEMDTLYHWEPIRRFIAGITGNERVYLHEDPSNALIVQMYKAGCEIGWHFDGALFASIINLSRPTAGGVFECVPDLRSEEDPGYGEVREVLEGRSTRVQKYYMEAGSLTLMLGRYTFHRVTSIEQEKPRISLVLTYELRPGVHLDGAARKRIFGPSAPREPVL